MVEIQFVFLVVSERLGITVCSNLEIAEDVKSNLSSLDPNAVIKKQVLFTPDYY